MSEPVFATEEIAAATGGTVVRPGPARHTGVTIDGRQARPGNIYVAIVGERFDGHDFVGQAVAAGATAVVVGRGRGGEAPAGVTVVEAEDPRAALGRLAHLHRRRWGGRVVGVTGSAGKTTTKGLVAAALAGVLGPERVLATQGSLNNETGVPLTLLGLRPEHEVAVIEMGMRGLGQIRYLAGIADPDVGVVLNAGVAHVGVVGSVELIAEGKSEIWDLLAERGVAIYPESDPRLAARAATKVPRPRHVTFGWGTDATVRVVAVVPRGTEGSDVTFAVAGQVLGARVPIVGRHNADNAAAALAVCVALGLDVGRAARGLEAARPASQRSEVIAVGGRRILLDCYNANPASTKAALETLVELAGPLKAVAVLGDMLELGDTEAHEHEEVGRVAARLGVPALVAVGERSRHIADAAQAAGLVDVVWTLDPAEAARAVAGRTAPGDWILLKASRGMRLERVLDALRELVG